MSLVRVINGPEVAAKLSAAIRDIARLSGFSEKAVVRAEAGSILKQCVNRTKIANPARIDVRTRVAVLHAIGLTKRSGVGGITINAGVRGEIGRVWVETNGGRGKGKPFKLAGQQNSDGSAFTPENRHWKSGTWTDIKEAAADSGNQLASRIPMGRQSAGLARQSWVQIADELGIRLESVPGGGSSAAIAKARQAMASNGRYYLNGLAAQNEQQGKSYFVTLINRLPYHAKAGLDAVLASVIAGRVGLYRRTFANGAFQSVQKAARNYPWMKTSLNP